MPAALAESFYRDVRCGLVHEARTKGAWLIAAVLPGERSFAETARLGCFIARPFSPPSTKSAPGDSKHHLTPWFGPTAGLHYAHPGASLASPARMRLSAGCHFSRFPATVPNHPPTCLPVASAPLPIFWCTRPGGNRLSHRLGLLAIPGAVRRMPASIVGC